MHGLARVKFFHYLLLASIVFSCSKHETNIEHGLKNQELHIGNATEPQDLDPHIVTGLPENNIINSLFEGLTRKDPKSLQPLPGVAKNWTISADKKVYTFYLRDDAKWSNGDPVTAHDFIYAWQRILSPKLGAQYAYLLYCIKNAEAFNKGEITNFERVGVRAENNLTLTVTLNNPTHFFLSLLNYISYFPVHKATIEKFGQMDEAYTRWTRQENIVSNGPFTLENWQLNRIVTVTKNKHYWNKDKVKLNKVHFHPVEDQNAEERMFRAGQLHITDSIPIAKIAGHKKNNPSLIRLKPYLGTYFYRFNVTQKPFDDVRVRQALAMTINRQKITEKITQAGELAAYSLTPPNTNQYTPNAKMSEDIQMAKKLLAEAGYPNGKGFPTVELTYNTSENHRKIAIAIQQMWNKHLNINIQLSNQEWKVFLDSQRNLNYHVSRGSWVADFLDPINFLELFVTNGGNNKTGWSNKDYDALIAQSIQTIDNQKRYAILQEAESILIKEAPIIPIYTYTAKRLISSDVKNFHSNILNRLSFTDIYLSREKQLLD